MIINNIFLPEEFNYNYKVEGVCVYNNILVILNKMIICFRLKSYMVQIKTLTTKKLQKEEDLREPEILQINQFTGIDTTRRTGFYSSKLLERKLNT